MEQLKILRKKTGLTQAEVATKLGIDRSTYAKYETGQSEPNFEMLAKIAELYEASLDYIINGVEHNSRNAERAATPEGSSSSEEFARLFSGLAPEDQNAVIAEMLRRGRAGGK